MPVQDRPPAIVFGPVPSRRLGRSLGINNVPPKSCSYSCRYCQVGTTQETTIVPRTFHEPAAIRDAVASRLDDLRRADEPVDHLTFVPDGEPGLDINLGRTIELLQPLGIPIAVISNASLLWREDVQDAFNIADWVSVKVDSVVEAVWKRINRPDERLRLADILEGIRRFAGTFSGVLVTETMLVAGVNDTGDSVEKTATFIHEVVPATAYLAIPIRPTADPHAHAPAEAIVNRAFQTLSHRVAQVEYLIGYEGNDFAFTGDIERDLLSITAVHPMRKSAVQALLAKAGCDWQVVDRLVSGGRLVETEYRGERFYLRHFPGR